MLILTLLLNLALLAPGPLSVIAIQKNPQGAPDKTSPRYETWLEEEVRHRWLLLPYYTVFDQLAYSVNGYTVTLTGDVVNPTLKSDAENTVKHIEGVERVVNQIHVLPNSPMDNQLRRAEYRKIYSQPQLFRYGVGNLQSIHIIVENGHVTLTGFVDNETDKNVAGMMANSVPNVFSVKNDLEVRNPK